MTFADIFWAIAFAAVVLGSLLVWIRVFRRWTSGRPAIARTARHAVPWGGLDLLAVVMAYLLFRSLCLGVGFALAGIKPPEDLANMDANSRSVLVAGHFCASLLALGFGVWMICLRYGLTLAEAGFDQRAALSDVKTGAAVFLAAAPVVYGAQAVVTHFIEYKHELIEAAHEPLWPLVVLSAVVVAPVLEEFVFRGLLQAWLEKVSRRRPAATITSTATTEGNGSPDHDPSSAADTDRIAAGWIAILVTSFLFALMHFRSGDESPWLRLAAVTPLFIFSLFLGYCWQKTHRLLPSITVHVLLNATTMLMVFLPPSAPGG